MVTFIDITETKRAERVQAARVLAESIVDAVREPLLVLDGTLRVVRGNRSFYRCSASSPRETDGKLVYELGSGQWNAPAAARFAEKTLHGGSGFDDFEVEYEFPHSGARRMGLNAPAGSRSGRRRQPALIVLGIEDVTEAPRQLGERRKRS